MGDVTIAGRKLEQYALVDGVVRENPYYVQSRS